MVTKFCIECGFENSDDANFCANCGMHLEEVTDSSSSNLDNDNRNQVSNYQGSLKIPLKYKEYEDKIYILIYYYFQGLIFFLVDSLFVYHFFGFLFSYF